METGSKFAGGSEKFAAVQVQGAMVQITAKAAPVCNVVSSMKRHSNKLLWPWYAQYMTSSSEVSLQSCELVVGDLVDLEAGGGGDPCGVGGLIDRGDLLVGGDLWGIGDLLGDGDLCRGGQHGRV